MCKRFFIWAFVSGVFLSGFSQSEGNALEHAIREAESESITRISFWDSLLVKSQNNGDEISEAEILNDLGMALFSEGQHKRAFEYYEKSEKIYRKLGLKKGLANVLSCKAYAYDGTGNIAMALDNYFGSLKLAEEVGDTNLLIELHINIGLLYQNQSDFAKAEEYLIRANNLAEQTGDKRLLAYSINNMGSLFYYERRFKEAIEHFEKAKKIREEIGDEENLAESYNNLGVIYRDQKNFKMAETYFKKSLEIHGRLRQRDGLIYGQVNLARLYLMQGKEREAEKLANNFLTVAKQYGEPGYIAAAADLASEIAVKRGKYSLALEMKELYVKMNDSVLNQETKKASIKSQLSYEYEKKATADSVRIAEEKRVSKALLESEKTQRFALFGGLILAGVFSAFMVNRFRVTNKQKKIIEQQKILAEEQKSVVEQKQEEILDSIRYAHRIQRALITNEKYIERNLKKITKTHKHK